MKKSTRFLLLIVALCLMLSTFAACKDECANGHIFDKNNICKTCGKKGCDVGNHDYVNGVCKYDQVEYEFVDYVAQCTLDMNSNTKKHTAPGIVRMYIDGDTTHFNVPVSESHPEGVLKARYLAVNTPESTGQVEPYGKVASDYTHKTLQDAIDNGGSVLVESDTDDNKWNNDTYGRTLAWVWYKPSADAAWRNLNLELLQKGYGVGSSASDNRYGEYCMNALTQASKAKLIVHSRLKDENYHYGDAYEIDLKELRTNFSKYEQKKVAFEGYVTTSYDGSTYVQSYNEEDGIYYGISVYYNASVSEIKKALTAGNHIRVVGTATDFNGSKQVSGLSYNIVNPDDPSNTKILPDNTGEPLEPFEITIPEFRANKTINVYDEASKDMLPNTFQTQQLIVDTYVTMKNLTVNSSSTTQSGSSKDAMTLRCTDANGNKVNVRTEVLLKKNESTGNYDVVKASEFEGRTITVVGVVDYFNLNGANEYQIRVISYGDIVIVA